MTRGTRATVAAVCVGAARPLAVAGRIESSAIDKRPVAGRVTVDDAGLAGDEQVDRRFHGPPDRAVYAYAEEDADVWVEVLCRDVPPGRFGENLRTRGLDVSGARIGERWRVGDDLVLEVSGPRTPCRTLAGFWDVPDMVARFGSSGRPGAYLRVVVPGTVAAGDDVDVVARPSHGVTVADVARWHHGRLEPADALRLVDLPELAAGLRDWAGRAIE